MKKRFLLAVIPALLFNSLSAMAQSDSVDLDKIREAGLRTAIVKAVPIEGKVVAEVFNGKFYSTSIETDSGLRAQKMHLSLVHEFESVIRSYSIPKGNGASVSVIDFIKPDFTLGLEKNDPEAKKMLRALRLVYRVDNVFPHTVKRNGADIWTLVIGKGAAGKFQGFRVRINSEQKPVEIRFDQNITKEELLDD